MPTMKLILHKVKLSPGKKSLKRMSDGAGNSGQLFVCFFPNEDYHNEVVVGGIIHCGSLNAGTFWATTPVVEIIEAKPKKGMQGYYTYVKFRTNNSVYEATVL